jgi:hypothetical protein
LAVGEVNNSIVETLLVADQGYISVKADVWNLAESGRRGEV